MTPDTNLEHDNESNADAKFDRSKVERDIGKFGKAFGTGKNSLPAMFLLCIDAAHRLSDVGPDDADKLFTTFSREAAKTRGIEYTAVASHKVQVSKLKRGLMLGALPAIDGVEVMNRAVDKIAELSSQEDSPLRGSAYDNMVKIARRQIESPTVELTIDEIEDALTEQPADKSALDMVIDAYKRSYRLVEKLQEAGVPDVTMAEQATLDLAEQIKAMDGELPPMTKEDRELAKAQGVLKARGLTAFLPVDPIEIVGTLNVEPVSGHEPGAEEAAA